MATHRTTESFFIDIAETNQLFHHKISPRKVIYTASAKTVIFSNGFNALKMRMQYILLFEAYIINIYFIFCTRK